MPKTPFGNFTAPGIDIVFQEKCPKCNNDTEVSCPVMNAGTADAFYKGAGECSNCDEKISYSGKVSDIDKSHFVVTAEWFTVE